MIGVSGKGRQPLPGGLGLAAWSVPGGLGLAASQAWLPRMHLESSYCLAAGLLFKLNE